MGPLDESRHQVHRLAEQLLRRKSTVVNMGLNQRETDVFPQPIMAKIVGDTDTAAIAGGH